MGLCRPPGQPDGNRSREQDKHSQGPAGPTASGFLSFLSSGSDFTGIFSTTCLGPGWLCSCQEYSSTGQSNSDLEIQIQILKSIYT